MRKYVVFYLDNGTEKSEAVEAPNRFEAKYLATIQLGILLSMIIRVV